MDSRFSWPNSTRSPDPSAPSNWASSRRTLGHLRRGEPAGAQRQRQALQVAAHGVAFLDLSLPELTNPGAGVRDVLHQAIPGQHPERLTHRDVGQSEPVRDDAGAEPGARASSPSMISRRSVWYA